MQQQLASAVVAEDALGEVCYVAGVATSHSRFSDTVGAAIAVLQYPEMYLVEQAVVEVSTKFPFIQELMSFREGAAVMAALSLLPFAPDVLMFDAAGVAHPRGLGLASHIGVVTDLPSVGCARATLVGSFVEPEVNIGSHSALVWQGEIIGKVYRSKNRVAPLFVSVGHKVDLETALRLVKECSQGYRLPEPTRVAASLLADSRQASKETMPDDVA